jgi:8-hydroxy-5-deazaflavin:NADPH oxidoreductase
MKIGIIGAGKVGGTLTRLFAAAGHEVFVANSRGPETLAALEAQTGATAVTVEEAARSGEVVVVALPLRSVPELPKGLFADVPASVVAIDTGNYYPERDGQIREIDAGMTSSRWVSEQLGRPVVKAFNSFRSLDMPGRAKPAGAPGRIALPVAGDDANAKAIVIRLVDQIGFDPVDAGTLDESWRQEPGSPAYGAELDATGLRSALAQAQKGAPA